MRQPFVVLLVLALVATVFFLSWSTPEEDFDADLRRYAMPSPGKLPGEPAGVYLEKRRPSTMGAFSDRDATAGWMEQLRLDHQRKLEDLEQARRRGWMNEDSLEIEVRGGDSLRRLARIHLGDPSRYRDILRANPNLPSGAALRPGERVRIPRR